MLRVYALVIDVPPFDTRPCPPIVSYWHKADIPTGSTNVCYWE